MALTENALAYVRARVGPEQPPTDTDLDDAFDRTGLATQVALDVLENRLAQVLANPSSYNVSGVYQEDYTSVITGLRDKIKRVQAEQVVERQAIADGRDPFAPVDGTTAMVGNTVIVERAVRAPSSWDRC